METDAEPVGHRQVLWNRRGVVPATGTRGRSSGPLPRRAGQLLRHQHRCSAALQPAPHLASATRDLLDRNRVGGRRTIPRAARGAHRTEGTTTRREPCVWRSRFRRTREPLRGIPRHQQSSRKSLVLAWSSGFGVSGPGTTLADAAGRRARALARLNVSRPAASDESARAFRTRVAVSLLSRSYSNLLSPGTLVWSAHQLRGDRQLALLDHSPLGGGFL